MCNASSPVLWAAKENSTFPDRSDMVVLCNWGVGGKQKGKKNTYCPQFREELFSAAMTEKVAEVTALLPSLPSWLSNLPRSSIQHHRKGWPCFQPCWWVALHTGLQNTAFLTSYDGVIYFHWHKRRSRASLIHSAAAGHCEKKFYMCKSYSYNTVCTFHTPCLRRKPFKRDLWLLNVTQSIYSQNLQPSILIIHVLLQS